MPAENASDSRAAFFYRSYAPADTTCIGHAGMKSVPMSKALSKRIFNQKNPAKSEQMLTMITVNIC